MCFRRSVRHPRSRWLIRSSYRPPDKVAGKASDHAAALTTGALRDFRDHDIGDLAGLMSRTALASDRFVDALDDVTGVQRGIAQKLEAMMAQRKAHADALYSAARAAGLEVMPENAEQVAVLKRVLAKPKFRQAFAAAQELADNMDDTIADIFTTAKDGTVTLSTIPDVRTLDYIKRGAQAVIEKGNGGGGLSSDAANNLRKQLRDVLAVYDELVPAYGEARQAFAGDSQLRDAYTAATDGAARLLSADRKISPFLQASADELRYALEHMTQGKREAYRLGGIASVRLPRCVAVSRTSRTAVTA
jgi:hypothetical protein